MRIREVLDRLDEISRRDLLKGAASAILGAAPSVARSQTDVMTIMNALSAFGNAWEDKKFYNYSKEIIENGPCAVYENTTSFQMSAKLTIVYGSGKFAVQLDMSGRKSSGFYDETSSGVLEKGRLIIDLNKLEYKTNPIFGSPEIVKLKLVQKYD